MTDDTDAQVTVKEFLSSKLDAHAAQDELRFASLDKSVSAIIRLLLTALLGITASVGLAVVNLVLPSHRDGPAPAPAVAMVTAPLTATPPAPSR